ncbi:HECT-domain (ubiquitin-transferase) [Lotmaria passim]
MMNGGERQRVTSANVSEYMNRLCTFYLQYVPDLALLHLRRGLQHTVNPLYLELFSAAELGHLFGSAPDAKIWESREHFARCIEAGHGYHKRSDVVQYLLDIVPQWSAPLQHSFLKFVTGSSCVPYGGLTQTIKVVRRDIDPANAASAAEASATHVSRLLAADGGATVSESAASATATTHSLGLNTAYDHTLPTVSTCFLYLKLPQYSSKAVLEERLRFAVCEGSNFFALT